ncbi:MAG: PAS domain S-box protein [Pirellulaceae bacterium]|nr:PAS domain S-box protein [Pirellulaceae bacterium]
MLTWVDITERKVAESELADHQQRLQAILQTASDAIVTTNSTGVIETLNPAMAQMFDWPADELIGSSFLNLVSALSRLEFEELLLHCDRLSDEHQKLGISEVTGHRRDGRQFPVEITVCSKDHSGFFTFILRDISTRKVLRKKLLEIADDEQRRIGQELHDGTQQELTGLLLLVGSIISRFEFALPSAVDTIRAEGSPGWILADSDYMQINDALQKLVRGLNSACQHVREISHGITPLQIAKDGLCAALEKLAQSIDSPPSIHCRFHSHGLAALPSNTVAIQLYRIVQEAALNAVRHANPTQIAISFTCLEGGIDIEVSDDGQGFEIPKQSNQYSGSDGIGLTIMKFRANTIGGVLNIERNDTGGTTVRVSLPVGLLDNEKGTLPDEKRARRRSPPRFPRE